MLLVEPPHLKKIPPNHTWVIACHRSLWDQTDLWKDSAPKLVPHLVSIIIRILSTSHCSFGRTWYMNHIYTQFSLLHWKFEVYCQNHQKRHSMGDPIISPPKKNRRGWWMMMESILQKSSILRGLCMLNFHLISSSPPKKFAPTQLFLRIRSACKSSEDEEVSACTDSCRGRPKARCRSRAAAAISARSVSKVDKVTVAVEVSAEPRRGIETLWEKRSEKSTLLW